MQNPSNQQLLDTARKHLSAAEDMYRQHPGLSCNQAAITPPSFFTLEVGQKTLKLVVSAPNDPRALPLIIDMLKPINSPEQTLVIAPESNERRKHTIPGILAETCRELNLPSQYPFTSIANPEIFRKLEGNCSLAGLSFSRSQLVGSIITNQAIGGHYTIPLDTLSGLQRLLKAWNNKFAVADVLQGAVELQDPEFPQQIVNTCFACVSESIRRAKQEGRQAAPDDPEYIEKVLQLAETGKYQLDARHILGYAVCAVSLRSPTPLPNYTLAIRSASESWGHFISLDEMITATIDWLVSHQPNFQTLIADNRRINRVVTETENAASAQGLRDLLESNCATTLVGWCHNGFREDLKTLSQRSPT